jgi:hypothetical protein
MDEADFRRSISDIIARLRKATDHFREAQGSAQDPERRWDHMVEGANEVRDVADLCSGMS